MWLRLLIPVHRGIFLVKFFIVIREYVVVDIKNILLLRSERVTGGINAALVCLVAQFLGKDYLVVCQVAVVDVSLKDNAYAFLRRGDMHQHRPVHQLLVILHFLVDSLWLFHMVNVEHHQSVQVTVSQTSVTEQLTLCRLGLVELTTREDEGRQVVLQLLGKSQQLLLVALGEEVVTC